MAVNGWRYDAEAPTNGHAWYDAARETSVAVRSPLGDRVTVDVRDERVSGSGAREVLSKLDCSSREKRADTVADGVEYAREWMAATAPGEWSHPDVSEAVFDAPGGYALAECYVESRETTVYYERADVDPAETAVEARGCSPEEYTRENCAYLYVHVYNGSGNATVALAPWTGAHGPASKHPELREVLQTPAECGLEVALTAAREWARQFVDSEMDKREPTVEQADLGSFGGELA